MLTYANQGKGGINAKVHLQLLIQTFKKKREFRDMDRNCGKSGKDQEQYENTH